MPFLHFEKILEIVAFCASISYMVLTFARSIFLWVFGIMAAILYGSLFIMSHLYGNAIQQFCYFITSVYGLITWVKEIKYLPIHSRKTGVRKISRRMIGESFFIFVALFFLINLIGGLLPTIFNWEQSKFPVADSILSAGGILAIWLLANRYMEQWLLFAVVNFGYTFLYLAKGLDITAVLSAIYIVLSILGFFKWKKVYHENKVIVESLDDA